MQLKCFYWKYARPLRQDSECFAFTGEQLLLEATPLTLAGPQRLTAPGSVRHPNSGVMALFINSGCFWRHLSFGGALNFSAFSIKAVHSSHLFKSFSAKSFCENLLKSQDSKRRSLDWNTLNESLRMCYTGLFMGDSLYQWKEGQN